MDIISDSISHNLFHSHQNNISSGRDTLHQLEELKEVELEAGESNTSPVTKTTLPVMTENASDKSSENHIPSLENRDAPQDLVKEESPAKPATLENFITLAHDIRTEFMLPWALCKTWKGIEELLKRSYRNNEGALKEIEEGRYKLYTDGRILFPDYWEHLVKPGWIIDIQLDSKPWVREGSVSDPSEVSDTDQDKTEEDGDFEGRYEVKATYTINYYQKQRYGDDEFLYRVSKDDPVPLKTSRSRGEVLPVLEEKTTVLLGERGRHDASRSRSRSRRKVKDAPKLGDRDRVQKKHLHIHSRLLINALRAVMKYSSEAPSGDEADDLEEGVFSYPYKDLFHHREELREYKTQIGGIRENHTESYNAECDRHIDFLLQYLENEPTIRVKGLEARWAKKVPTTTFTGLWLLLKPGSDVYVVENGQLNAYVVDAVLDGVEHVFQGLWAIKVKSYSIRLWNLVYDGKVIKRRSKLVDVPVFDNERNITSLPLFPTRFHDNLDGGARRKELIERGKMFFRCAKGPAFLEYTGSGLRPGWKRYNRARVVVEHESHPWNSWAREDIDVMEGWVLDVDEYETDIKERAKTPHCECHYCSELDVGKERYISGTFSDYDSIDPKTRESLSDHQYLLCMSHMFGFILKDRTYDLIDVSGLAPPRIAKDSIDQLVMRPESNRNTIKAIAQTYTDSKSQAELFSADFIHGKGEGQIFLLHGPPGTGKTLTAESVAEYTKRPLLSITAADLGHEPVELERNLLKFFRDANSWDAIVLLDEADVYLERRSSNDLKRNSIVSIFLRALEYFQGILFLTTNRVGDFDEAFLSRIHVAIGYEPLDDAAREQIWSNLFRKLKEDHKHGGPDIHYEYDAKEYVRKSEEIKKLEWNGREIRNAFQSAVALALYDSKKARERGVSIEDSIPEVREAHLKEIAHMSTAFKNYITSTHQGVKDSDIAYRLGIRDDNFGKSQKTA
ncbi:hypothetical protein F4813DRAFT_40288 [Daldinia decipiens]|uniref:uncharacterized protein n=1 Tax=Daldinia decipiens TaxID=326647 RepID=UPI0020C5B004|nr:uncharacterized protein F4813DRAFT_40288 [Daldinia decipiens]KAI1658642.1 hypothetical protein F4813DRAFT_40288 [Daldinia decipiens]